LKSGTRSVGAHSTAGQGVLSVRRRLWARSGDRACAPSGRRVAGELGATGVGAQVRQLAGLDPAVFDAGVEVLATGADREPEGWEPAVADHLVSGVDVEVEVPGGLFTASPSVLNSTMGAAPGGAVVVDLKTVRSPAGPSSLVPPSRRPTGRP
jgi:hypothetical protein